MTRYSAKIRFEKDGELMGPHAEAEVYVDVGPEGTETAALAALYAALEQVGYHMRRTLEVEDGD